MSISLTTTCIHSFIHVVIEFLYSISWLDYLSFILSTSLYDKSAAIWFPFSLAVVILIAYSIVVDDYWAIVIYIYIHITTYIPNWLVPPEQADLYFSFPRFPHILFDIFLSLLFSFFCFCFPYSIQLLGWYIRLIYRRFFFFAVLYSDSTTIYTSNSSSKTYFLIAPFSFFSVIYIERGITLLHISKHKRPLFWVSALCIAYIHIHISSDVLSPLVFISVSVWHTIFGAALGWWVDDHNAYMVDIDNWRVSPPFLYLCLYIYITQV